MYDKHRLCPAHRAFRGVAGKSVAMPARLSPVLPQA
jgi:hypothetical protein